MRKPALAVFATMATVLSTGALAQQQPKEFVYSGALDAKGISSFPPIELTDKARGWDPSTGVPPSGAPAQRRLLSPSLQNDLASSPGTKRVTVIALLLDTTRLPEFPEATDDEGPTSAAALHRQSLIAQLSLKREQQLRPVEQLADKLNAVLLERFWLVPAVGLDLPLSSVPELAKAPGIASIALDNAALSAPSGVSEVRAAIGSDPWFALGLTQGRIGQIDSGIRNTHNYLVAPNQLATLLDCRANSSCAGGTPAGDECNHGTPVAGILSANSNGGNGYRGVTGVRINSYKIFTQSGSSCTTSSLYSVRAIQAAVASGDKTILIEVHSAGDDFSAEEPPSIAADAAFDTGAAVIVPNGNFGPTLPSGSPVGIPAAAHKVLGVGAYTLPSLATWSAQSQGPTVDGRVKPDIQTPTNVESTSANGDTATMTFGGTSAAGPSAAGIAALFRNYFNVPAGIVYAMMLRSGHQATPNNTVGAGRVAMPSSHKQFWGQAVVTHGQVLNLPLNVCGDNQNTLDAAIWWPEALEDSHGHIKLQLVDPSGVVRATGNLTSSVFQKARVAGALSGQNWTLRITGQSLPAGVTETVYWAASHAYGAWVCN